VLDTADMAFADNIGVDDGELTMLRRSFTDSDAESATEILSIWYEVGLAGWLLLGGPSDTTSQSR